MKKVTKFKLKPGRRRSSTTSHKYSPGQWAAHESEPAGLKALRWIKNFKLEPLLYFSHEEILESVYGPKPDCFGFHFEELEECAICKRNDSGTTEGFYDPNTGKGIGPDSYGVFTCCWICSWVRALQKL